jgi:hypothetical protein
MSCILTNGIPLGCLDSTGGIKNVLIAKYDDAATSFTEAAGVITAITSTETFYQFKFRNQTSSFTEEGGHSVENGTNFWTQTVNMIFHKLETDKRNAILLLAKTDLHIIVETQNGDYWMVGKSNGANLTASASATGQAYGDLNGWTIALTGTEPEPANEIDSAVIATLTISA